MTNISVITQALATAVQNAGNVMGNVVPVISGAMYTLAQDIRSIEFTYRSIQQQDCLMGVSPVARAMAARDAMEGKEPRSYRPFRLNDAQHITEKELSEALRPMLESIRCFQRSGGVLNFGTSAVTEKDGVLRHKETVAHGAFSETMSIPLYPKVGYAKVDYEPLWEDCFSFTLPGKSLHTLYFLEMLNPIARGYPLVSPIDQSELFHHFSDDVMFLLGLNLHLRYELPDDEGYVVVSPEKNADGEIVSLVGKFLNGNNKYATGFATPTKLRFGEMYSIAWSDMPYYLQIDIANWFPEAVATLLEKYKEKLVGKLSVDE
jgi:hypothetical protein